MQLITLNKDKCYLTIILLHGLNQNLEDVKNIANSIVSKKRNVKVIIPYCNKMFINWPNGVIENVNSWYNYYTKYDNKFKHDLINLPQFYKNIEIIKNLIEKESNEVILCGISQGGTVAIHSGLLSKKINRIICIDTIFMHTYFNYSEMPKNKELFIYQSSKDDIYNPSFQNYCYKEIEKNNNNIYIDIFDTYHCESISKITNYIITKIAKKYKY